MNCLMKRALRLVSERALVAASLLVVADTLPAIAQAAGSLSPDIVVTATRNPLAIQQSGSAITIIPREEIERRGFANVADALRQSPGVGVVQTGGPGGVTTVRLRGAEARHTLVLIDGVRVNDASAGAGEFDFSTLGPANIERIEILRGPQSALYGSDAIGGVINIITRQGHGAPRASASVMGGSYGTKAANGAVSGSNGPLSYAFGLNGFETAGFSSYGYRIKRLRGPLDFENDSTSRVGASGRVGYTLSEGVSVEAGGYGTVTRAEYDAAFGAIPDTPSTSRATLGHGYTRLNIGTPDGRWRNSVTLYANRTDRKYNDFSYFAFSGPPTTFNTRYGYRGERTGLDYQSDMKLDAFGQLTVGAQIERERFLGTSQDILPFAGFKSIDSKGSRDTRSLYALHQISVGERLHLSLSGRLDDVEDVRRFGTWRFTAAYDFPETDTKLRTSFGTAAKAPSLFQLYSPLYGSRGLNPEQSFGLDVGIDQTFLDGRIKASATAFTNRIRDLIDFDFGPVCPPARLFGCYINVAKARTSGLELSLDAQLVPNFVTLRSAYTYLDAVDANTDKQLPRRPRHEGRVGLAFTPLPNLTIEPSIALVGKRFDRGGEVGRLAPYARLDTLVDYKVNDTVSLFARAENLTNTRYEEARTYGTAGRSVYVGAKATW